MVCQHIGCHQSFQNRINPVHLGTRKTTWIRLLTSKSRLFSLPSFSKSTFSVIPVIKCNLHLYVFMQTFVSQYTTHDVKKRLSSPFARYTWALILSHNVILMYFYCSVRLFILQLRLIYYPDCMINWLWLSHAESWFPGYEERVGLQ